MRSFIRCGKDILMFAILFVMLFDTAVFAKDMEKPGVTVYVIGDIPDKEKKILSKYLLTALVNRGNSVDAENSGAFLATVSEEQATRGGSVGKGRLCELGRQFNIRYLFVASVTTAFGFFDISARMVDAETEEVIFKGEAQSSLRTIEDLTQVSDKIAEDMFGVQTEPESESVQSAERMTSASTAVVSLTGEAKAAVDRVVVAVNAFKDATAKSIEAANAVKTATQSRNFSAIKDAKNKVESATEAVKRAKTDVETAIDALKSAGPDAEAAVKAMGIDLKMFAGKEGDKGSAINTKEKSAKQTTADTDNEETAPARKTKNGVTLGYVYSGDMTIFQAGFTLVHPIAETGLSFVWETNILGGWGEGYNYYDGKYLYATGGVNIPLLFQFDQSVFSLETGVSADILGVFGSDVAAVFNAGFVIGGGLQFGFARFFYRFNYGTSYYSQMFGVRMLF